MASQSGEFQVVPIASSTPILRTRSYGNDARDLESASSVCCRICLENQGDDLITPCRCKGTQEFVHRRCLDNWRSIKEGFAFSHCTTCRALFQFRIGKEINDDIFTRTKLRLLVVRDVFRDFLIAQAIIAGFGIYAHLMDSNGTYQNALSGRFSLFSKDPFFFYYSMGALAFLFFMGCFFIIPRWSTISNANQRLAACQNFFAIGLLNCFPFASTIVLIIVVVFILFGAAFGLFALSMAAQRSWHTHYQRLAKKDLTQVYVVVDQHGHYTTPTLDPVHERRLRELNLL